MRMKTVVTGASGLLGREIYRVFKETCLNVVGTAFSRADDELMKLDLTDFDSLEQFIEKFRPDYFVHSAAERKPDVCSDFPEKAEFLNVGVPKFLSEMSRKYNFRLIYISTDYVFDGAKPPYFVDDSPNPLNFYGKTKLAGEIEVLRNPKNLVLRVPILYGHCEKLSEGAVTIIAENLLNGRFEQDHWAVRYPTLTTDVGRVLVDVVTKLGEGHELSGVFHWSGDEPFTKYSMALVMAEKLGINIDKVVPLDKPAGGAPRPKDCHLDTSRLEKLGICHRTPFAVAIEEIITAK